MGPPVRRFLSNYFDLLFMLIGGSQELSEERCSTILSQLVAKPTTLKHRRCKKYYPQSDYINSITATTKTNKHN